MLYYPYDFHPFLPFVFTIKTILLSLHIPTSLGGVLDVRQEQTPSLLTSSSPVPATIENQNIPSLNYSAQGTGGGRNQNSLVRRAVSAGNEASSQTSAVSFGLLNSPFFSLSREQYQDSLISIKHGDFIIYDKDIIKNSHSDNL
ncbi:MAG: hypothetical protein Q8Q10_02995 [bacterium]|nr:hypothetical protein [bacterium]